MKHIFVVHSNITYLVSLGVVRKEGLDLNDILIISDGYNCSGPIPITVVKVEANRNILKKSLKRYFHLYFNPRYEIYKEIDKFLMGDKFIAYVPVLHLIKKLVLLHEKCEQFHFIEEGVAAYYETNSLEDYAYIHGKNNWFYPKGIRGLKQRIHTAYREFGFKSGVIESIPLYYMNHDSPERKFYGLSKDAHPAVSLGVKEVLDLSSLMKDFTWSNCIDDLSNKCVWIGDPDVQKWYGEDLFKKCLEDKLIPFIQGETLYVRFHYRESDTQRKDFLNILKNNSIDYVVVDDKQIVELIFIKSKSCKCIGLQSSLLIYSKLLGQDTYSVAEGIPAMKEYLEKLIPCFSHFVTFI